MLMKAVKLQQVDLDYRCHLIAYLTRAAAAEKSAGKGKTKPVYKTFEKFFDYKKAIAEALKDNMKPSSRLERIKAYRNQKKEE